MGFCLKEYFQTAGGLLRTSTNISVTRSAKGGGLFEVRSSIGKPFIPFCGVVLDASGALKPDTIAHHKTFVDTFVKMFLQFLAASNNARDGLSGGTTAEYVQKFGQSNIDFSQYLVTKIGQPQSETNALYAGYLNAMNLVWDFWNMSDAAWSDAQLFDALAKFQDTLRRNVYPRLYIPPGQYLFNTGNTFEVAFSAWIVAVPTLTGFRSIELDSIA